jgi:hypothetical protein
MEHSDKKYISSISWHQESDQHMPVAAAKAFARLIETCESHILREANHFLHSEQTVNEQILARMRSAKRIFDSDMQACPSNGR